MRLVDHDAVRQAGPAAHAAEPRQQGAHVLHFRVVTLLRQINHDAAVRVAERLLHVGRRRRRIAPAQDRDARQSLERAVVTFGIDHAEGIAMEDQLLAEQPRHPRFSRPRVAGDEDIPAANGERELAAVFTESESQTTPRAFGHGQSSAFGERSNLPCHVAGACAMQHHIRRCAQRRAAPFNRDSDLGEAQQLVIVLRVADGDRIPRRGAQDVQRGAQPGGLADPLGHPHDPAAIEYEHQRQLQRPNHVEHHCSVHRLRIDQRMARAMGNAPPAKFFQECGRRRWREHRRVFAVRKVHDAAVLGDDPVHEVQISGEGPEVIENATGDEQHEDPAGTRRGDRLARTGVQRVRGRDGPVVIERKDGELHGRCSRPVWGKAGAAR